jgi:hypothetical protein
MGRPKLDPIQKFWSRVDRRGDDECWSWLGSFDKDGYGQIWDGHAKKGRRAHKMSAAIHFGERDGHVVCHTCDNPECTNPKHLFYGTVRDNNDDKMAKNRHAKGEIQGSSKLNEKQVADIRNRINEDYRILCEEYELVPSTVYRIWNGQAWKHSLAR